MKGLDSFDFLKFFDFRLNFYEKRAVFKRYFYPPRGSANLYVGTIENRRSSHAHKNWISKSLGMIQKQN